VRATQEDQGSSGGPPRGWQRLVTWSAASSCFLFSACCFATFCSHACLAVTCAWNCAGGCRSQQPLSTANLVCASARSPGSRDAPRPYRAPMAGSFGGGRSSPTRSRKALATEAQSEGGGSRGHVSSTCLPHSSVCQRSQSQLLCLCSRSSSGNRGRADSEPEYPSVGSSVRS
jgi:hypothetical protein